MIPHYLLIEDFMSHRRTEIDCTKFNTALIIGQSKLNSRESNGVGKSVIYHAIKYALFGAYPTSVVDNIVRDGTDGCSVTFDFELGPRIFRIIRGRRKGKSHIKLIEKIGDSWDTTNSDKNQKTSTETNKELAKLIRVNCNAVQNSVLFSQNDLDGLASAKSQEDRKVILKNALELSYYKKLEELVKKEAAVIVKKAEARKAVVESLGDPKADIEQLSLSLDSLKAILEDKERSRDGFRDSLVSKKSELASLQQLANSEVISAHDKLSNIKNNKIKINNRIYSIQNDIKENDAKLASLLSGSKAKTNELSSLSDKRDELRNKSLRTISKIKKDLDAAAENELNGKAHIASLDGQVAELRKPIPDGEECPTCHQEITDDYKGHYSKTTREKIEKTEADLADKRKKLKAWVSRKLKLQNELDEINKTNSDIMRVDNSISSLETEIKHNADYTDRLNKANSQKYKDIECAEGELEKLCELESSLNDMVKDLSTDDVSAKLLQTKKDIDELDVKLQNIVDNISVANKDLGVITAKIDTRTSDLDKLEKEQKEFEKLQKSHKLHKKVQKSFSSSGIPTLIINTILDDLQVEANTFLSSLKPGLELQFTENLDLYFRIHGCEREYQQLSGGQKMLIAFALKLGLSVIIQRRLGIDIKFLLLDEVDQSLDEAAVDTYVEVIRKLQDSFKIFVITHNQYLKDKFEHTILVEGDPINGATARLIS